MPGSLQVDKEATTALLVLLLCFKPNISDIFQQSAAVVPSKECLHTSRDLLLSSLHPFITSVLELASKQGQQHPTIALSTVSSCTAVMLAVVVWLFACVRPPSAHLRDFFPRMKVKLARVTMAG